MYYLAKICYLQPPADLLLAACSLLLHVLNGKELLLAASCRFATCSLQPPVACIKWQRIATCSLLQICYLQPPATCIIFRVAETVYIYVVYCG
jgi:hypothetical protein